MRSNSMKTQINLENVQDALDANGYADISTAHIIGFRTPRYDRKCCNKFVDYIAVIVDGNLFGPWPATTRPGLYYTVNPMNGKDTCSIHPGQYVNCFQTGTYKNYTAIRQIKAIKYYVDDNKDAYHDDNESKTQTAIRGTHIHKAGRASTLVDRWSAGCQVFAKEADFNTFMKLIKGKGCGQKNDIYTYTLLNWE